jgi:hypothetical protein
MTGQTAGCSMRCSVPTAPRTDYYNGTNSERDPVLSCAISTVASGTWQLQRTGSRLAREKSGNPTAPVHHLRCGAYRTAQLNTRHQR